jgi:NitT/TauT family transport system permease protein
MNNQSKSKYLASFSARNILVGTNNLSARLFFNLAAFFIVMGFFVLLVWGTGEITEPIYMSEQNPIVLDANKLPSYAFQTLFRMLIAAVISIVVAIVYAYVAAKNKYAEEILIPLLDILQSIPILGYISFTVTGFVALFPNSILGAELAAIFAIFTSQVWNIIFSFYQSLKTIPKELVEASQVMNLSSWQKFWKMELPYGIPGLVWNTAVSISSSWFFVVAAEAITIGSYQMNLEGIGSYIALAIAQSDIKSIFYSIYTMILIILLYDQLIMSPIVAWSHKFRYEMSSSTIQPRSWVLNIFRRSTIAKSIANITSYIAGLLINIPALRKTTPKVTRVYKTTKKSESYSLWNYIWYPAIVIVFLISIYYLFYFLHNSIGWGEVVKVFILASITCVRVFVLIIIASLIWVPLGVYIGLNPKLTAVFQPIAQFLAAFPANLLFPISVILVSKYDLNPNIWLSPLMIMGAQWYILFNVIAGAASMPNELKETAKIFKIDGLLWWRKVMIPTIIPYFLTGAITASGGAWNASIVAEIVSYGDKTIVAAGLGSYIAEMTTKADFQKIVLGIGMMCMFVVVINKFVWQPLHDYSSKKFQL